MSHRKFKQEQIVTGAAGRELSIPMRIVRKPWRRVKFEQKPVE